MAKNLFITYILWLIGGWVGLHHFYLKRDRHAFIWWATAGGIFGLGWFRDLWRIPEYVANSNENPDYMEELTSRMRRRSAPAFCFTRFAGQIAVGMLFGMLSLTAIPEEWTKIINSFNLFLPLAIALGVTAVGNIGNERCNFKVAAIGAYLSLPLYYTEPSALFYGACTSAVALNWKGKEWRREYSNNKHVCKRFLTLVFACSIYTSLWTSALYHNAYVTIDHGDKVKLKEVIGNFFNSPAWAEMKHTMWKLYDEVKRNGWDSMWEQLVREMDPEGELNAYKELGVKQGSSENEIRTAYKKLAKIHHPDREKDPAKKDAAQQKFMQIQQAYETLSNVMSRRQRKSEKPKFD